MIFDWAKVARKLAEASWYRILPTDLQGMTLDQAAILLLDANDLGCGKTQISLAEAAAIGVDVDTTAKSAMQQAAEIKASKEQAEKRKRRIERRQRRGK